MSIIAVDISHVPVPLPIGPLAPGSPVWVEVRPNLRRAYTVAGDILTALGKNRGASGKGRNEHQDLQLAAAWLQGHDSSDLILTDAQRLHPKIVGTLCRLAHDAKVDLWLLHRPPCSDAFLRALDRRSDTTKDHTAVPPPVLAPAMSRAPVLMPAVPRHDIHLFRAACKGVLNSHDLAQVLATHDDVARTTHARLNAQGATAETIAACVDDVLADAPDDNTLITAIRGVQLAAWHHDLFVKVDLDTLLHSENRPTLARSAVDDALAVYRQPHRVLTCALTRRGHPLDDIHALRVSDASPDGVLTINGHAVPLTPPLTRAVRSARLLREATGVHTNDQLLPYATNTLAACLTDAANDLGLHVKGRRAERSRPGHTAHLRRLGLTLIGLT